MRARTFAAALLCTAMLFNTGCAKRAGAVHTSSDTLTIALPQEPVALNPLLLEGPIAYAVSELLYSYLTNYDSDGNMVPDVALHVPTPQNGGVSRDGRRITFHLRHGVQWQDGAPLTARDVVFTYRAIMSASNALPERFGYDKITSIAAPDAYTVVITLKRPYAPIVPLFFGGDSNYPILPEHILGRYPSINKVPFNQAPIGAGPYMLAAWKHGDRLELKANPRYHRGKPAIAHLVLPFIHDPATTVNELVTHEIDAAFSLDASRIALLRTLPGHRIIVTPAPYFYAMAFNMNDPLLRDRNMRRALALAIDRDTIVRKVSHGVYDPASGLRGLFTWSFDPSADRMKYDPQMAGKLLDEQGWTLHSDGSRYKGGKRLQLQLALRAGSQITTQFATAIVAAEQAIGVDVVLRQYTRELYLANDGPLLQGRFQMQIYDYSSNYDPDASWLLACDQRSPAGFNIARYCDAGVDEMLTRATDVFERPARRAAYASVQRRISEDLPYFFLAQASEIDVIPASLEGYQKPLLSPFNSVGDWSFGRGRAARSARVTKNETPKKRRT